MDLVFYFHIGRSGVGSAPLFDICQDLCTHVSQRLFIHRFSAHSFLVHRWMYLTTSFLTGHPICKNLRRTLIHGDANVTHFCYDCKSHKRRDTRRCAPVSSGVTIIKLWLSPRSPLRGMARIHSWGSHLEA